MSARSWFEKIDERTARGMSIDDARNTVVDLLAECRRRGQMLAHRERQLMTATDAWKAFRMGIVASCPHIPKGNGPDAQAFWKAMRARFGQWLESYNEQGGKATAKRVAEIAGEAPGGEPFNPPRTGP